MASIINATTSTGLVSSADNSGSLQLATNNGTTAVTIDTSQNVGIGTASPLVTSAGRKVVTLNGTTDAMFNIGVNGTYTGFFYSSASNTQIGSATSIPLQFYTGDVERMRIASDGAISAGSTTGTVGLGVWSNYGSRIVDFARYADDGAIVGFKRGATLVGNISVTGSATAYNTSSDYRLKENIEPMTGALAVVGQLKPCTYTWKADGSNGQGFIAHELAEVVPQAVTGEKDALDKDGNPEYQGIDVSFLVATLTAAIQELNEKVEAQAVRIAELEGAK